MIITLNAVFRICLPILMLKQVAVHGAVDAGLQQRQKMLENQVQAADRDLKSMANKLMRTATFQVENAANKLQIAKSMETVAANVLTTNGLNDLNNIERFGLSSDIRQCYELNKFSFGDAVNTAKNTAMQCIDDKVNEGKTIADNAINDIRSAMQNISGAAQLMAQCTQYTVQFPSMAGLVAKVSCLGKALLSMKSSAILLPINLGRRGVEANAAISTIQSDILMCNLNIMSAILTQATNAGQAIANCTSQSSSANNGILG